MLLKKLQQGFLLAEYCFLLCSRHPVFLVSLLDHLKVLPAILRALLLWWAPAAFVLRDLPPDLNHRLPNPSPAVADRRRRFVRVPPTLLKRPKNLL